MAHESKIQDTETHFIIDPNTRTITNSSAGNNIIVQHDHNSERFTFEIPRYVDGHDMSECTEVRVNYRNATSNGLNKTDGVYICNDLAISEEDEDKVTFSWLLSSATTQYIGSLYFSLVFVCLDGVTIAYAWNTGIYKDTVIIESINNSEEVVVDNADAIASLREELMTELESVDASITVKTNMGGTQTGIIEETNELHIKAGQGIGVTVDGEKVVLGIDSTTFPKDILGGGGEGGSSEFTVSTQMSDLPTGEMTVTDTLKIKCVQGVSVSVDGDKILFGIDGNSLPDGIGGDSLPEITANDAGKVLTANADGTAGWKASQGGTGGGGGGGGTEILTFDSVEEMNASNAPEGSIAIVPSTGGGGGSGLPTVTLTTAISTEVAILTAEESAALDAVADAGEMYGTPIILNCVVNDGVFSAIAMRLQQGAGYVLDIIEGYAMFMSSDSAWVAMYIPNSAEEASE